LKYLDSQPPPPPLHVRVKNQVDRVLQTEPRIDEIDLFESWPTMEKDVKQKVASVLNYVPDASNRFIFIKRDKLKEDLVKMGRWLVEEQGINEPSSAVYVNSFDKSSPWIIANLMEYSDVQPRAFHHGKMKHIQPGINKIFFVDDALYSGMQMWKWIYYTFAEIQSEEFEFIVAAPYVSRTARDLLNGLSERIRKRITIYEDAEELPEIQVNEDDAQLVTRHLFMYEFKVPDWKSVPADLSKALTTLFKQHLGPGQNFPPYKNLDFYD
jgi:hypothetical protein